MTSHNTIAAISTPPGKGGVALLRISGEEAFAVAARVFRPRNGREVASLSPRTAVWGDILYEGEAIDDGLLTLFPAPHSYTGEHVAEIACHGGLLLTRTVLEALLLAGARLAEPGEFTRRAFVAGKLSLTEAEAIGGVLDAKSTEALRLYREDSRNRLSGALCSLYDGVLALVSEINVHMDYPDEDLGELTLPQIRARIEQLLQQTQALCATWRTGRAITEGISTVLCGRVNVGKSALYNCLAGREAAIVTDIAGTTRDVLETTVPLGRVLLRLFDTAGVRENTLDPVEKIGIERTRRAMEEAELLLAVFDRSRPLTEEDLALIAEVATCGKPAIALCNKSDLPAVWDPAQLKEKFHCVVEVSAAAGSLGSLSAAVEALTTDGALSPESNAIVSSARQYAGLKNAADALQGALVAIDTVGEEDAAASELMLALAALGETDGRTVSEDVVSRIFSAFCVGK